MNLEDVLSDDGLQQDEWSLTAPTFGKDNQLTVVGWSGKRRNRSDKFYILLCSACSEDDELFGEGYFKSVKTNLSQGKIPCGCGKHPKWSKEQFNIRCERKSRELGYTFLGFVGEWKAQKTKIKMSCEKHGEWSSGIISALINQDSGCPKCANYMLTKPDDVMIQSFHDSGVFDPNTVFWRSQRRSKSYSKPYWFLFCPECGETGESTSNNLQQGCRPCACSKNSQQECYINLIKEGENIVAVKFGIARDSKQRIRLLNHHSVYIICQHSVYKFPDVFSCKKAEKDCKQELECGVVLKRDMKDGYTETTWTYNLDKIIEIYERNGGVRQETLD